MGNVPKPGLMSGSLVDGSTRTDGRPSETRAAPPLGLRAIPRIARPRATNRERRSVGRVGDEVEGRGLRDRDAHDVARPGLLATLGNLEVHEATVFGPAAEPVGLGVLLALARGDEHLDRATDELLALLPGDAVLQCDETLVALLHDRLRHLVLHRRRGRTRADRGL